MTHTGKVLGATRTGIRENDEAAVLGRACFETAPNVLAEAAIQHESDPLESVSSRLAIGMLPQIGAHAFDILSAQQQPKKNRSMLDMPIAKRARFGAYINA